MPLQSEREPDRHRLHLRILQQKKSRFQRFQLLALPNKKYLNPVSSILFSEVLPSLNRRILTKNQRRSKLPISTELIIIMLTLEFYTIPFNYYLRSFSDT